MGVFHLVVLCIFLLVAPGAQAIKGGTTANLCDFPGLAVVIGSQNEIYCSGVISDGGAKLYMPPFCLKFVNDVAASESLVVTNGFSKWIFQQSSVDKYVTIDQDNRAVMTLSNKQPADDPQTGCSETFANFYDGSTDLNTDTCQIAGWGAVFDGGIPYVQSALKSGRVTKSSGIACCKIIKNSLSEHEGGTALNYPADYNCVTSDATPCGIGDMGIPVVCDTNAGTKVTIALVANTPCTLNDLFYALDTSGSSDSKIKFGYSS